MAKRHFISVLGTGNYTEVKYVCGGEGMVTTYVQEAVLKLKMLGESEFTPEDRITIFVTEEARARNWCDRDYTKSELERMNGTENPGRKTGLCSILQKSYNIPEDAARLIPLGATEDELWEIFNRIYEEIQDGEALYVDITHSLRNIPIQMLSVIAYARVLKKIQVMGIYYGAFEAGTKNEAGMTEAPIFDLLTFLDILDWSQAASSFIRYGNSDEIKALCDGQKNKGSIQLRTVINDLSDITQGLEASRGCFRQEKGSGVPGVSVLKSYRSYQKDYGKMRKAEKKAKKAQDGKTEKKPIDPLTKLFDVINDKLKIFDVEDNLTFGFAAIDWAIENKKTQQGFTALDETIKTWLCRRYGLDECQKRHREGICKMVCNLFDFKMQNGWSSQALYSEEGRDAVYRAWEEAWESQGYAEQSEKERLKEEGRSKEVHSMEEGGVYKVTPEKERNAARLLVGELPPALIKLSSEISRRRNSMNHFGYSNINQFGSKKLYEELQKYNEKFREVIALMENGEKE